MYILYPFLKSQSPSIMIRDSFVKNSCKILKLVRGSDIRTDTIRNHLFIFSLYISANVKKILLGPF